MQDSLGASVPQRLHPTASRSQLTGNQAGVVCVAHQLQIAQLDQHHVGLTGGRVRHRHLVDQAEGEREVARQFELGARAVVADAVLVDVDADLLLALEGLRNQDV